MENINFDLYKIFYCVAKNKNITKASNELFITQPAITQSIRKLEEQLEVKLFYRTKRGMELTSDGQILYDNVKISIEHLNRAKLDIIESHKKIIIRIGSGTTLIKNSLIEPLKKFKKLYPEVIVEINHEQSSDLIKMIDNNLLDMVILNFKCSNGDNYVIETIEQQQDIFTGSTIEFNDYKEKIFSVNELNNLPLVLQSKMSTSRKFLDNLCNKQHITLKAMYELDSYGLVLDFVRQGLGIGFVNKRHVRQELIEGSLFELKVNFDIPPREICAVINKKVISNEIVKDFIKLLKEQ